MLRMVCTRGGARIITVESLPAVPETLALVSVRYSPTHVMDGIKSLSYGANMLVTRLAKEQGGDEALLVTPHGRVLEGPRQSFVASLDGEALVTPPAEDHILDSITRKRLIESGRVPSARSRRRAAVRDRGVPRLDDARGPRRPFDRRRRAARRAGPAHAAGRRGDPRADRRRGAPARGMKILTVIGNRPQFVKAAAVSRLLRERHEELLIHTGQHYDDELSRDLLRRARDPARRSAELAIGGGSNGAADRRACWRRSSR